MSQSAVTVIQPQGRLDALGARELWQELEPVTDVSSARVLVDMSGAKYVSSEGLRVLMRASKAVKQNGGKFVLCNLNPRVMEIVNMAGLDRVLEIYPSRHAAQRALDADAASGE
jgi:anti-sigma B factor antagonist